MRHQAAPILAFWARLWPETLQRVEGPSLIRCGSQIQQIQSSSGGKSTKVRHAATARPDCRE